MVLCGLENFIGCENIQRNTDLSDRDEYKPPSKVVCSTCGKVDEPKVCMDDKWIVCCFIPIYVILGGKDPYLVCKHCKSRINLEDPQDCNKCGTELPGGYSYCSNCGDKLATEDTNKTNK